MIQQVSLILAILSMVGKPATLQSIERVLENTHQEIENFNQLATSSQAKNVSMKQVNRFLQNIKNNMASLKKLPYDQIHAKTGYKLDQTLHHRLYHAISILQKNPEMARQMSMLGQDANVGNVLLGLWKTLKKKTEKSIISRPKRRVEAITETYLLSSTEKEIEELIEKLDRDSLDDKILLVFIRQLRKHMHELKKNLDLKKKVSPNTKLNSNDAKKVISAIQFLQSNQILKSKIHKLGQEGQVGNLHLMLWKTLKQVEFDLKQMIKGG